MDIKKQREQYFQNQKKKIIAQLKFAKQHVPFYKENLKNTDLNKIKNYTDFYKKIPLIDSTDSIRNPKLFTSDFPIVFVRSSSSTTGKPKNIFLTKHDLRHWADAGRLTKTFYFKKGMVVAHSKRKEKFYLSNLNGSVKTSKGKVLTFNPKNKSEILECIQKSNMIIDYAEMIYYIAKQLNTLSRRNLNKNLIISYTGNKLSKKDIKEIKKNFRSIGVNIKIYSEYATSEIGPIGYAIEDGPFKIIYSDNVFVEVINPKNNLPCKKGEIIITALNRTGSVFIRYKIGDIGELYFKKENPYFDLKKRTSAIKVASIFFSPQYIFSLIRNILKLPVFCYIELKKGKISCIKIKIISEKRISKEKQSKVKVNLINKMHFEGDIGSTVNIKILFENRKFNEKEIRKGFIFSNKIS